MGFAEGVVWSLLGAVAHTAIDVLRKFAAQRLPPAGELLSLQIEQPRFDQSLEVHWSRSGASVGLVDCCIGSVKCFWLQVGSRLAKQNMQAMIPSAIPDMWLYPNLCCRLDCPADHLQRSLCYSGSMAYRREPASDGRHAKPGHVHKGSGADGMHRADSSCAVPARPGNRTAVLDSAIPCLCSSVCGECNSRVLGAAV